MSSARRSGRPTRSARSRKDVGATRVPCPVCGRKALLDVVEDCRLSGGRQVRRLRHTRCEGCGERFFDVAAMKAIERSAVSSRHRRSA